MDEWSQRLNDHQYHGGETPDEADFTVYSYPLPLPPHRCTESSNHFTIPNLSKD